MGKTITPLLKSRDKINSTDFYRDLGCHMSMLNTRSLVRQEKIVRILMNLERASNQDLAAQLGVSNWTVRRDLDQLVERRIVGRYHGGVALVDASAVQADNFDHSLSKEQAAKERIGQATARLLQADQSIVLGGGTTTTEVARHLKARKQLRIMTNSLNIALDLSQNPNLHVTCTGGSADGDFYSLTGSVTERALSAHYFDVAVLGVGGLSLEAGLTVASQANAAVLRLMIEHARKCIVVADHSKFGQVCFASLAPLNCMATLVTDVRPSALFYGALRNLSVHVIVADEGWRS